MRVRCQPTPAQSCSCLIRRSSFSALTLRRPFPRPTRPQVFFGREDELKIIIDLIFSSPSAARIAILGPGGVGKTALAHAVLTHVKVMHRFGDSRRYLVPCESLTSRDALLVALANSLSLLQPGTTSDSYLVGLEPRVLSAMGSEESILCLDNFESPWDQPGPNKKAVEMLLADITALSSVTVLITMRGGERPKETAWTLPMLRPLSNLPRDAAKRTWESHAGTCDEWAEKLIDAVDCLPLAVTLLGSLAEVSTAETLWERWEKENIAIVEKEKGDKLASLEFSIALSLECGRMTADGSSKRLLGILSMLPDGMPVFPSPEFRRMFPDIPHISRSLDTLLKCSLAVRTADKRVQVNSLVRLYCERNDLSSQEDRWALRDYYVMLASHGYDNLHHDLFKRMAMEMSNMESVLRKSLAWTPLSEIAPVIEAIIAYTQFCLYIGDFSDVAITCATEVQGLPDETLGDCLTYLGSIYLSDDKVALAGEHFKKALDLHESAQDVIGQANDHCHLGDVLYRCDKMEEAKKCYQKAFDLNVQSNSPYGQADALTHLGDTYRKLGRLEESCSHYQRSLMFHEEHHDLLGQANNLKGLGHVYLRMDNIKLAEESFKKALKLHRAVNDLVGQANDISSLADIYQRLDNLAGAEKAYKEALDLHNQAKDDLGRGNTLSHLGDYYRKQNELSEAESHYIKALQSHEKAFDKLGQANDLKGLGGIYHKQGNTKEAIQKYNAALSLYKATGNSLGKANCQRFLGGIFYSQKALDDALTMFQCALENYNKANETIGRGNCLNSMGDVARKKGELSKAEQLYKQALQAHKKANDKLGQGNDYKGLGIVYQKLDMLQEAKEMFEKAIEMHRLSGTTESEEMDQAHLKKVIKKLEHAARTKKMIG
jgi:tetratricopeptide (TPR) repeat protein